MFDRINHLTLLNKLEHYGFRGVYLNIIKSYLSFRRQKVVIDNAVSEIKQITSGVPQGSILGPLLFNIYINDVVNVDSSTKFVIYADDTTLFFISRNATELLTKANSVLATLNEWSMLNSLTINSTKTKAVMFRAKNQNYSMDGDLLIGASKIEIVASVKSLGIIFEEHLNWTEHTDLVSSRVARVAGILVRLRFVLPTTIKLLIYKSLFLSHLSYCFLVWGNTTIANITRLERIQKKAVRAISNVAHDAHTPPLFKSLGVREIHHRYNDTLLKRYHIGMKQHNNFIASLSKLTLNCPSYPTRHFEKWHIPLPRTNYGKQSLQYSLPSLLNRLSCD